MIEKLTVKIAKSIVGGLSEPSKMPGFGFSLSPKKCKVGSKLRKIKGSICSACYACRGHYCFPEAQNAFARRFDAITKNPHFVEAMVFLLNHYKKYNFFRWFDAGDIPNMEVLNKIVEICKLTPNTRHWIPTKEYSLIAQWVKENGAFPENLTVRLSAYMMEGLPPEALAARLGVNTSSVQKRLSRC
jgi:hypothetical protein